MTSYPYRFPASNPILTLTHEAERALWIIELHNEDDSRLTPTLINEGFKPALDIVERDWRQKWRTSNRMDPTAKKTGGEGAVIIVGNRSQDKFFSNGLDWANSRKDQNFFPVTYNPLLVRLLTFPLPTIAAINGHCFAGGFMLAAACDYRVMTDGKERRAWLCMNEVHFGGPWPYAFATLMPAKFPQAKTIRMIALEGHRFTPEEALQHGIIDKIAPGGSTAVVLDTARDLGEHVGKFGRTGVWGIIRRDLYHESIKACGKDYRPVMPDIEDAAAKCRL